MDSEDKPNLSTHLDHFKEPLPPKQFASRLDGLGLTPGQRQERLDQYTEIYQKTYPTQNS